MLKRILSLTIAITMILATGTAFAAAALYADTANFTITGFRPSKSVSVTYNPDMMSGTTYVIYSIASKHQSGNKIYGTDSATTKMFQKDGTGGTALTTGDNPPIPTNTTTSAIASGWTAM